MPHRLATLSSGLALSVALPALLAGCGALIGIGDVQPAPADASIAPTGDGGQGVIATDGSGVAPVPDANVGGNEAATGVDTGGPPPPLDDAGTDGGGGGGDGATEAGACSPPAVRCSVNSVETCQADNQWGPPVACPTANPYCNLGLCGACAAGTLQCAANGVQTCSATGSWGAPVTCASSACVSGACTGDCTPSSSGCTGDAGTTPETCSANGTWQLGGACPYVCNALTGACGGSCVPGALQCNLQQPQKCDATGTWQNNGGPCASVCSAGACAGSCTPNALQCSGLQPQKCSSGGTWQNSGSACAYVCSAGACSGSCVPSSTQCSGDTPQTCSAAGAWVSGNPCTYVCTGNACGGVCSPTAKQCVANNSYEVCSSNGQWGGATACVASACVSGACTGTCVPGSQKCNASNGYVTCGANGQWGTTATTCTNSACVSGACTGSCVPGTKQCTAGNTGVETCDASGAWTSVSPCVSGETCSNATCACPSGDTLCSTTCTATQTDPLNCGTCGHSCLGGGCSAGLCQPITIAAMYGGTFNFEFGVGIDSSNIYFSTGSDGRVGVCPLTGCTVINPSGGATIPTYVYTAPSGGVLGQMLYDVAAGNIYLSDSTNGVIYSITTAGSLNWTITGRTSPEDLTSDGTNLYWAETGGLMEAPLANPSTVTSVYSTGGTGSMYGAWYDPISTNLFGTIGNNPGDVVECPPGSFSGSHCSLGTSAIIDGPLGVLTVGSTIFFTAQGGSVPAGGGLFSAPVSNPSQITGLATGAAYGSPLGMTADANFVYFVPYGSNVFKCPVVGGCGSGPATLTVQTGEVDGMANDSQFVYWGSVEKVMKVAK